MRNLLVAAIALFSSSLCASPADPTSWPVGVGRAVKVKGKIAPARAARAFVVDGECRAMWDRDQSLPPPADVCAAARALRHSVLAPYDAAIDDICKRNYIKPDELGKVVCVDPGSRIIRACNAPPPASLCTAISSFTGQLDTLIANGATAGKLNL